VTSSPTYRRRRICVIHSHSTRSSTLSFVRRPFAWPGTAGDVRACDCSISNPGDFVDWAVESEIDSSAEEDPDERHASRPGQHPRRSECECITQMRRRFQTCPIAAPFPNPSVIVRRMLAGNRAPDGEPPHVGATDLERGKWIS
jgi:hypothetical protein